MITFLAQGLEVVHTSEQIFFRVLFPWTGRTHVSKRVVVHRSGDAFASWALYLTYVEAHELCAALANSVATLFNKDGVTITKPLAVPDALEIVGTAFPFACMVPDALALVLWHELRKHLDAVGLPHNIDLETGLDEGTRPWRGGWCVCQRPDDPYHPHRDEKPHECVTCTCRRWRGVPKATEADQK